MKRSLYLITLAFIFSHLFFALDARSQIKFKIVGKTLNAKKGERIYLCSYGTMNNEQIIDSTIFKTSLLFKGNIPEYTKAAILNAKKEVISPFFIIENGIIKISEARDSSLSVTGGLQNYYLNIYNSFDNEESKKRDHYKSLRDASPLKSGDWNRYQDSIDHISSSSENKKVMFFKEKHNVFCMLNSICSHKNFYSHGELDSLYNYLSPDLKRHNIAIAVKKFIDSDTLSRIDSINQKDITGKQFRLIFPCNSKYVLLDFWASWCGPCRENSPIIKSLYDKYKSRGLMVIGVMSDDKHSNAINAVQHDEVTWTNLYGYNNWGNDLTYQFGVTAIPKYILLDKNGKIIQKYNNEIELLQRKIDLLFN